MPQISFLKMSGAGNDFVIVDVRKSVEKNNHQFSAAQIAKISARNNVGCDQFILLKNSTIADALMEIYNSDGSISGACGNATRCVASILMSEKLMERISVETASGVLQAWRENDLIAVNMGYPKFDWVEIPLTEPKNTDDFVVSEISAHRFTAVNMGNPHIVTFVDQVLSDDEFFDIGPKLETNSLFPQKTNVEFAKVLSPSHIAVRVWERGSGETLACGSGACAVAVAAIKRGLIAREIIREKIKISFKGGDLFVQWSENGSVIMSGGYQKIFSGVFDEDFL